MASLEPSPKPDAEGLSQTEPAESDHSKDGVSGAKAGAEQTREEKVRAELERRRELVPFIGKGWRWYDFPWRLSHLIMIDRKWWAKLPRGLRAGVNDMQNRLMVYYELDRAKVSWPEDPMYNVIVPEGELIEIPSIWVVEYYSPAYASDLAKRLSGRGWPKGRFTYLPEDEAKEHLRRARELDGWGGMSHIGTFRSPESGGWDFQAKIARLPEGVRSVDLHLVAMGSSLTAVVAEFYLTDDARLSVDRVARQEHPPRITKGAGRLLVDDSMLAGVADIQAERDRMHNMARSWLAKKLPGMFAVEGNGRLPVLDLVITRKYDSLTEQTGRSEGSNLYRALLGRWHTSWTQIVSPDWPGLRIDSYTGERGLQDDDSQWALLANWGSVFPDGNVYFNGERSTSGIANAVSGMSGAVSLISRLGLYAVLSLKQKRGAVARDLANRTHSGRRPVTSVKKLRRSVLTSSLDVSAIASDIIAFTANRRWYESQMPTLWDEAGPWATPGQKRDPEKGLLSKWAKRQSKDAVKLLGLDSSLVTLLGVVASLTSSIESIRSQRWSILVGVFSLIAAMAAVYLAYLALNHSPTLLP